MINDKNKFKKIINMIANEKHSFGNQLLYDMCNPKTGPNWYRPEILADKIWLIGRAYAASPERRYVSGKSPKVGDGTGAYFNSVAQYILNHFGQQSKIKDILKNKRFCFDFSDNDFAILFAGISSALEFNSLVKRASKNYDEGYIEESKYKNQISFCSKFLHFHFPKTVFIIDGFSNTGANLLVSKGARTNATIKCGDSQVKIDNKNGTKGILEFLSEDDSKYETFCEQIKESNWETPQIENYALHCLNAYKTAYIVKKILGDKTPVTSYPRVVDTLFLKVKSDNQKNSAKENK